eukprot:ANDGO_02501.mRNA.1 hypothetical protein
MGDAYAFLNDLSMTDVHREYEKLFESFRERNVDMDLDQFCKMSRIGLLRVSISFQLFANPEVLRAADPLSRKYDRVPHKLSAFKLRFVIAPAADGHVPTDSFLIHLFQTLGALTDVDDLDVIIGIARGMRMSYDFMRSHRLFPEHVPLVNAAASEFDDCRAQMIAECREEIERIGRFSSVSMLDVLRDVLLKKSDMSSPSTGPVAADHILMKYNAMENQIDDVICRLMSWPCESLDNLNSIICMLELRGFEHEIRSAYHLAFLTKQDPFESAVLLQDLYDKFNQCSASAFDDASPSDKLEWLSRSFRACVEREAAEKQKMLRDEAALSQPESKVEPKGSIDATAGRPVISVPYSPSKVSSHVLQESNRKRSADNKFGESAFCLHQNRFQDIFDVSNMNMIEIHHLVAFLVQRIPTCSNFEQWRKDHNAVENDSEERVLATVISKMFLSAISPESALEHYLLLKDPVIREYACACMEWFGKYGDAPQAYKLSSYPFLQILVRPDKSDVPHPVKRLMILWRLMSMFDCFDWESAVRIAATPLSFDATPPLEELSALEDLKVHLLQNPSLDDSDAWSMHAVNAHRLIMSAVDHYRERLSLPAHYQVPALIIAEELGQKESFVRRHYRLFSNSWMLPAAYRLCRKMSTGSTPLRAARVDVFIAGTDFTDVRCLWILRKCFLEMARCNTLELGFEQAGVLRRVLEAQLGLVRSQGPHQSMSMSRSMLSIDDRGVVNHRYSHRVRQKAQIEHEVPPLDMILGIPKGDVRKQASEPADFTHPSFADRVRLDMDSKLAVLIEMMSEMPNGPEAGPGVKQRKQRRILDSADFSPQKPVRVAPIPASAPAVVTSVSPKPSPSSISSDFAVGPTDCAILFAGDLLQTLSMYAAKLDQLKTKLNRSPSQTEIVNAIPDITLFEIERLQILHDVLSDMDLRRNMQKLISDSVFEQNGSFRFSHTWFIFEDLDLTNPHDLAIVKTWLRHLFSASSLRIAISQCAASATKNIKTSPSLRQRRRP